MDIVWNQKELDTFWHFITERQRIWHLRMVEAAPPWTDDPILQRYKFTNVYRELDPGTQFVFRHILERDAPRPDIVFNVMLYRLMCSIPTYEGWGFRSLDDFDWWEFEDYLGVVYNSRRSVFGNAYLISPYSSMGSKYKFQNVARLFGLLQEEFKSKSFFEKIDTASTMEKAFKVINAQYGFGPFLAYQVLVDLTYPLPGTKYGSAIIPLDQNDWARLGPGALRGFARLSSTNDGSKGLNGLRWLRENQRKEFYRLDIQFPYLHDDEGFPIDLTLPNLQNCLCEFHKYRSIQDGTGKSQRIYVPPIYGSTTGRIPCHTPN